MSTLSDPLPKRTSMASFLGQSGQEEDSSSKRSRSKTVGEASLTVERARRVSYSSYGDHITELYGDLLPTLIPLNRRVPIHLAPKFFTPEERGFDKIYLLIVTLKKITGSTLTVEKPEDEYAATVEFHERKVATASPQPSLAEKIRRSRSVSITSVEAAAVEVEIIERKSLKISGSFQEKLDNVLDDDKFDLILCPSTRVSLAPGELLLMGTLYTKLAGSSKSKRDQQWKAAVRPRFD